MFRSYSSAFNKKYKQYEYKITDSDFVVVVGGCTIPDVAIAKEYARRNLPVAKNMALLCLYMGEDERMELIVIQQDLYCGAYIDNWAEIAAERDRYLDKLSAMK